MSRILKRPMFRDGGRANSRGTGIMTGIEDREEYKVGGDVNFYPRTTVPTIQDVLERGYGSVGAKLFAGQRAKESAASEVARAQDLYNKLGFVPNIETLPSLPYEPTGKPFQGQPSFRSVQEPSVYTPETTETIETTETTQETTPKTTPEPKSDEIDFSDFEESVRGKSEIFEKMLTEGGKKQAVFKALTAAAPELLKEDYGAAIKAAGEELSTVEDVKKQAKLLAIQEEIKLRQIKAAAEAKATGSDSLQKYQELSTLYPNMDDEEKRAIAFGTQYQKKESPEDVRFTERQTIQAGTDTFKKNNSAGYEQAAVESVQYGIDTVPYIKADPADPQSERIIDSSVFRYPGQTLFDPILRQFYVVSSDGTVEPFKNRKDALDFAKQQVE